MPKTRWSNTNPDLSKSLLHVKSPSHQAGVRVFRRSIDTDVGYIDELVDIESGVVVVD